MTVAISAVNLKGEIPVTTAKIFSEFGIKGKATFK